MKRTPPSHLAITQAAKFAGVSQPAITQAVNEGRLPFEPVFGVKMIPLRALKRWMRARGKTRRSA